MNATQIRESVTDTIVQSLEQGGLPAWRRPWANDPNALGLATSLSTGKPYNGINQLLLQVLAIKHSYQSKWFGTFKQIKDAGASVKKGEKAIKVVLFKPIKREDTSKNGETADRSFLLMRQFSVFSIEQCTGFDQYRIGHSQQTETIFERLEAAEELIKKTGVDLQHGGNRAFYSPSQDRIQMPRRSQFDSSEAYYATLMHELVHWSEKRIEFDRTKVENSYALGELIADLGASFLLAELGLPASQNVESCAAYIDHWLRAMKADTKFIFKASATASKAADFLLSHIRTAEEQPAADEATAEAGTR